MATKRKYDLVCFDVDGTLITHPSGKVVWEVLNRKYTGTDEINQERFRMYRAGEITYADWVRLDVEGWIKAGATYEEIVEAVHEFEIYEGALATVHALKESGVRLAVISGTIDIVVETLFTGHMFDDVYTNKIHFDEHGRLVGWEPTPFDLEGKPVALKALSEKRGVSLSRSAFVGDGDNDVPIIGVAGCVIAFNPRSEELERGADFVIKNRSMVELLHILS
jgi:HAD superfamily PSPase-like hydrolase